MGATSLPEGYKVASSEATVVVDNAGIMFVIWPSGDHEYTACVTFPPGTVAENAVFFAPETFRGDTLQDTLDAVFASTGLVLLAWAAELIGAGR